MTAWILYALDHKVKNLEVDLSRKRHISTFNCLFTRESLDYLRMNGWDKIEPDIVCFPKLRSLSLRGVSMPNDSMQKVLSGCPVLETLSIKRCIIVMMNGISFQTVKSLTISCCKFRSPAGSSTFTISAPCLKYIYFDPSCGSNITFKDMSKVTEAKLLSPFNEDNGCDILSGILGVETLAVGTIRLKEFLTGQLQKCRKLQKLKLLSLGVFCMHSDFGACSTFLKLCPNLEHLQIVHNEEFCRVDGGGEVTTENIEEIEASSCQNLKLIVIVWYQSDHSEQQLKKVVQHWTKKLIGVQLKYVELTGPFCPP